ncbi:MAG: cellulose binding domain-containing protein [Byssovorax sp.]
MGIKSGLGRWLKVERASVVVILALAACATGVDPVRPAGAGTGTGGDPGGSTTGDPVGPSSSQSSSNSASSTTVTSSGAATSSAASTTATSTTAAGSTTGSAASTSASSSTGGVVMGLSLQYLCADVNAADNQMKPHFNVVNGSPSSVSLASLTIRYYFTAEGNPPLIFECDYAKVGCGNLAGVFGSAAGVNADHYLEVSFTAGAGTLSPGAESGEVQARFHNQDYSNINQANDYSFDPTKTAFTTWDKITLYQGGVLVWGMEP